MPVDPETTSAKAAAREPLNLALPGRDRFPALDGLRAVAALMVFVNHVQLPGLHPQLIGMDAGVLVFFALSGYLLYAPFVAACGSGRPVDLRTYAIRRFLRIAPAYLVAAIAVGAIFYPATLRDPIGIVTMSHTPIIVAWTLQLEVVFYAILPLLAAALGAVAPARRTSALILMAGASILGTVVIMTVLVMLTGHVDSTAIQTFPSFIWAFVPGMLVAELQHRNLLAGAATALVPVAGIVLIAVSVTFDPPPALDLPAGIGAGLLIAHVVARPNLPAIVVRPALIAGALSYSFYLWHEAIIPAVDRPATWSGAAVALVLSTGVSTVIYLAVERPSIELGRRLSRRSLDRQASGGLSSTGPLVP